MVKVRLKYNPFLTGTSNKFNIATYNEVIVNYEKYGADCEFIYDLEVLIDGKWIDMREAFKNSKLITDNENTKFFEPISEEERKRGYRI